MNEKLKQDKNTSCNTLDHEGINPNIVGTITLQSILKWFPDIKTGAKSVGHILKDGLNFLP